MPAAAPKIAAIIVAAGSGIRMGSAIPKQYLTVQGSPMLRHSVAAFAAHPSVTEIVVVIGHGQEELAAQAIEDLPVSDIVIGGISRRDSVRNGLNAVQKLGQVDHLLIHDAARPFLNAGVIDRLLSALTDHDGAVPALPIVDSLSRGEATLSETVPRENLWRVQTPQAFRLGAIMAAHAQWDSKREATDDARIAMAAGYQVAIVAGDEALAKYTFESDLTHKRDQTMVRTGNGFDVHRLERGEQLWLCGVNIEHTHGLSGHSDADVAIHALVDAILGAAALGDIGDHFPPSDPQWRGASSDQFLVHAIGLARAAGFELANADITIICEAPKIGPHKLAMRQRLAEILTVQLGDISVKATTTERLGFAGRQEGIAAQASVALCGN